MLNPETVVLRRKAGIARYPALSLEPEGAIEDLVVRVGGGATEIELELLFDIQIAPQPVNVDDVRTLTSKLWELTEYDGEQTRAPIVHMFWGKVFSMRVVFDALAERLDAISSSGAARRSWLSARLIRVADPPRRTTEDVLANPRPATAPDGQEGGPGEQLDDALVAQSSATPPDADEEIERRAAIESGLWDWVRDLVEAEADPGEAEAGGAGAGESENDRSETTQSGDAAGSAGDESESTVAGEQSTVDRTSAPPSGEAGGTSDSPVITTDAAAMTPGASPRRGGASASSSGSPTATTRRPDVAPASTTAPSSSRSSSQSSAAGASRALRRQALRRQALRRQALRRQALRRQALRRLRARVAR